MRQVIVVTVVLLFLFESCKKDDPTQKPVSISTLPVVSITSSSAKAAGKIISGNGVIEKGICFAKTEHPTINNQVVKDNLTNNGFSVNLNSLEAATTYYVKAFATTGSETIYGNEVIFTTLSLVPSVPQDSALSIYVVGGNSLYSFNALSGQMKWKKDLGTETYSSPAYYNGKIYINASNQLQVFDTSGVFQWSFTMSGKSTASPIVRNGIVYTNTSENRDIYAIDANSGNLRWHVNATLPGVTFFDPSNIMVVDNILFISSAHFYAYNAITGDSLWEYGNNVGQITPVVKESKIYLVDENYSLCILDKNTGQELSRVQDFFLFRSVWSLNVEYGQIYSAQAYLGLSRCDSATVSPASFINNIYTYDGNLFPSLNVPLVSDSTLYLPTLNSIWAYDAVSGEEKKHFIARDGGNIIGCPTILNGIIYFGTRNDDIQHGHFFARDIASDNDLWSTTVIDDFTYSIPCVVTKSGLMYRGSSKYD